MSTKITMTIANPRSEFAKQRLDSFLEGFLPYGGASSGICVTVAGSVSVEKLIAVLNSSAEALLYARAELVRTEPVEGESKSLAVMQEVKP